MRPIDNSHKSQQEIITEPNQPINLSQTDFTAISINELVEQQIRELKPNQSIYLDSNLMNCERGSHTQLTITKLENGQVSVFNGSPSQNSTCVGTSTKQYPIQTQVLLTQGRSLFICEKEVKLIVEQQSLMKDSFTTELNALKIGGKMILGRNHFVSEPNYISRRHCTITRVEDIQTMAGQIEAVYMVEDGVKGNLSLFVDTQESDWFPLIGKVQLGPGRMLKIDGVEGYIQIPQPASASNYSQMLQGHVSVNYSAVNNNASLCFRSAQDLNIGSLQVTPSQAQALGAHIYEGIRLIRAEEYKSARKHFENEAVLTSAGYHLSDGIAIVEIVTDINSEQVYKLLRDIASRSWFFHDSKTICPCKGEIVKKHGMPDAAEQQLLKEFERELSLIYAEEWLHCYQHALGSLISKKGLLIEALPIDAKCLPSFNEWDVAQFFREQRVPMSNMFKERYGRVEALALLNNYATKNEQTEIRAKMLQLSYGETLMVGLSPIRIMHTDLLFEITKDLPNTEEPSGQQRQNIEKQIRGQHVAIQQLEPGQYLISPLAASAVNGKVFYCDTHSIWRNIDRPQKMSSGQLLRLGSAFEFQLA